MGKPSNDRGWVVESGGQRFLSRRPTIALAFQEFITKRKPKNLGALSKFTPRGAIVTDDNTYFSSTEYLLRDMGKWTGPPLAPSTVGRAGSVGAERSPQDASGPVAAPSKRRASASGRGGA